MKIGDYIFLKKSMFTREVSGDCFYSLKKGSTGKIISLDDSRIEAAVKATSVPEVERKFFIPIQNVICLNDVFVNKTFGMLIKDDLIASPVVILDSKITVGGESHKYSITEFNPVTFIHNKENLQLLLFSGFNDYKVGKAWDFIEKNCKMVRDWKEFTDIHSDVIAFKVTPKNSRKFLKFFKVYIQYSPESSLFPSSICQIFKIAFKNKIDLSCSIINYGDSYKVIF